MTRQRIKDKARYFGPYSSVSAMWITLKLLNSLFPLRRCRGAKPKKRARPCLNQQIGRCLAPCCGLVDKGQYKEMVKNVVLLLEGDKRGLIKKIRQQMNDAAEQLRFEEAALLRDQVHALEKTLEKQIVVTEQDRDFDILGFCRRDNLVGIAVLHIGRGRISGQQVFCFREPPDNDERILTQVLVQYYGEHPLPGELLLPFLPMDHELLAERFTELAGTKVILHVGQRGNPRKLLTMARKNSEQVLAERLQKKESWQEIANGLKDILCLGKAPERIECLDISNISGKQAVGALVSFKGGIKNRADYRHYKIKTLSSPDDYAMMAEVLERRLRRGLDENNLPDLLMVDGGKGQLNVAVKALCDFALSKRVELVGIAKEKKEEGEKLYRPGRKNPLILPRNSPILLFLMRVRDESHRYGITFHRNWRRRDNLSSGLDKIPGVGKGRRQVLLQHIGSLKRISRATVTQLAEVPGIGPALAQQIYAWFHDERKD
jgi:excinuclease ABC subunit C